MLILNWGFLLLSVGAIVVGMVLTRGAIRTWLGVALALFLVQMVIGRLGGFVITQSSMVVYSAVQGLVALGQTGALVAAAVVGARQHAAAQAALAAQNDEVPQTWTQPQGSPDPRLLAD